LGLTVQRGASMGRHRRTRNVRTRTRARLFLFAVKAIGALAYTVYWCWKLWALAQQWPAGPWC
jgi:uncharacterized membrane protein YebE (DUF533 family)